MWGIKEYKQSDLAIVSSFFVTESSASTSANFRFRSISCSSASTRFCRSLSIISDLNEKAGVNQYAELAIRYQTRRQTLQSKNHH